jgi:hypothetical protein
MNVTWYSLLVVSVCNFRNQTYILTANLKFSTRPAYKIQVTQIKSTKFTSNYKILNTNSSYHSRHVRALYVPKNFPLLSIHFSQKESFGEYSRSQPIVYTDELWTRCNEWYLHKNNASRKNDRYKFQCMRVAQKVMHPACMPLFCAGVRP